MPSHLFIKVNLLSDFSWGHSLIHCVLPPHASVYCKVINGMHAMMKCRGGRKWRLLHFHYKTIVFHYKTILRFSSPVPPDMFESEQRTPWEEPFWTWYAYPIACVQHGLGIAIIYQAATIFKILFHLLLATIS